MKSIAIIGARLNSSRLPGKHLLPLAGKPLIEQLLHRLQHCTTIDKCILATTNDDFNNPLTDWAASHITCSPFSGDVNDLMGRIDEIVQREQPDYVTYICGDCPLVAPDFIDHSLQLLQAHPEKEKISLKPEIKSIHEGIEIYSIKGWNKLMAMSNDAMTREHVGYANKLTPSLKILFIDDSRDYSSIDHRISVDTPADYDFMKNIYQRWYDTHSQNSIVSLQWVQQLVISDTSLKNTNAHVVQKNPQHNYHKVALFCHVSHTIGMGHLKRITMIAAALQENLALGTTIHVHGIRQEVPWLTTNLQWHKSEEDLLLTMKKDRSDLWILDFQPSHIDLPKVKSLCLRNTSSKIIAIDKLENLIEVVDHLYIPAFHSSIDNSKVSYGWQHYFVDLPKVKPTTKKQITILTGGSDALGYGEVVPKILEVCVPKDWDMIWIQGPYAAAPNFPSPQRWTHIKNPDSIQTYISESSLILSCYGLSLFESIASQNLSVLMPPQKLCDEIELSKLESYEVCVVTRTLDELKEKTIQFFDGKIDQKTIFHNASSVFSGISGSDAICSVVDELFSQEKPADNQEVNSPSKI